MVLGSALWGVAVPVDPGEHVVEAHAPDRQAFQATVTVKEREGREVVVHVEAGAKAVAAVGAPAAAPSGGAPAPPPPPPPAPARSFGARHRASLAVGGVAVALAGAGVATGIAGWQEYDHLASRCNRPCANSGTVRAEGLAANVLYGAAATAAATSIVLFTVVERERSVSVAPTQGGCLVGGAGLDAAVAAGQ